MRTLGLILLSAASCSWAANPQVANVTLAQDAATRLVTVTYDLAGADAIVTLDVTTNGVSVGARNLTVLSGDVNRKVSAGTGRRIVWNPDVALSPFAASATAVVSVWREDAPPDYMAINLCQAGEVRYYADVEALPYGGLANDCYRKDILLMRRIPAKGVTWYMGQRSNENGGGSYAPRETRHQVTMTNDYWMGVFEFTNGQWRRMMPSYAEQHYFTNIWTRETRPVESVSYQELRGGSTYANWPASSDVSGACLIGRLRAHAGLPTLDLPTDAQWEYACRAGSAEALYSGHDLDVATPNNGTVDAQCNLLGRYFMNGGGDADSLNRNSREKGTTRVGSYQPNDWGLYDMLGNVYEWCLDRCESTPNIGSANAIDPVGPATGDYRVRRGGCWGGNCAFMRAAYRGCSKATDRSNAVGFRLAARIVESTAE